MDDTKKLTYKDAGVDTKEGERAVTLMKDHVKRTFNENVLTGLGSFGSLFQIDVATMSQPVLVSGTDGVGTKLKIAFMMDKHDTVGIDCVAMCVNDVLCQGAKPLFFLDYIATGKVKAEKIADIVKGIAEGCRQSGSALVGGETAEMPDILVVTLANNVSIRSEWIDACVQKMADDPTLTAVVPVYIDNDHHPLRAKTVGEDGLLHMYEKDVDPNISTNRQDLPPCYFLAHNFWVLNVQALLTSGGCGQPPWKFMGDRIAYYPVEDSVDLHHEIDLYLAKEWIKANYTD